MTTPGSASTARFSGWKAPRANRKPTQACPEPSVRPPRPDNWGHGRTTHGHQRREHQRHLVPDTAARALVHSGPGEIAPAELLPRNAASSTAFAPSTTPVAPGSALDIATSTIT